MKKMFFVVMASTLMFSCSFKSEKHKKIERDIDKLQHDVDAIEKEYPKEKFDSFKRKMDSLDNVQ